MDEKNHVDIFTNSIKEMFNSFIDEDTKEFINNMSQAKPEEKAELFKNYLKEQHNYTCKSPIIKYNTAKSDIDALVRQKREIEDKIQNLSEEDRIYFWIKYHNIPNDTNEKIDVLTTALTALNSNINEKFDDINTEITIMKKHIGNN